jgi:hypothetical protein
MHKAGEVTDQDAMDAMMSALEQRRQDLPDEHRTEFGHPEVDHCFGSLSAEATFSLALGLMQLVLFALTFPVSSTGHMLGRRYHLEAAKAVLKQRVEEEEEKEQRESEIARELQEDEKMDVDEVVDEGSSEGSSEGVDGGATRGFGSEGLRRVSRVSFFPLNFDLPFASALHNR